MSKVLLIRHLPLGLSFDDKQQLLKHFGAEKVWETKTRKNYIFAAFPSVEQAKTSLHRLHQLEIAQRRLVVEFSFDKEPVECEPNDREESSAATKHITEFLRRLNAWNPSVDFYQPPPNHVKYTYPKISADIIINIIYALYTHNAHKPLYKQTLHLMNKMSLEAPFGNKEIAIQFFKETFRDYFIDEIIIPPPPLPQSESESEMSSEENIKEITPYSKPLIRKHTLPKTRKRASAILSTAAITKPSKKSKTSQKEVFEETQIQEPKKISVLVNQDALQKPAEEVEVVGELGKFEKEKAPTPEVPELTEIDLPTITKKELLKNRISYSDMKMLPVFKNYHAGQPSMRLYLKNLAKNVTEQDVKRIYKRYVENLSEEEQIGFDVRVMQEGRLKGQGFVTFPSLELAERALHETNGYILNEKPLVVQFARVANKKPIE